MKIRARETFDSSATPEVGKVTRRPSVIAPVDIEKLGGQIQATLKKAKENDPLALRQKITELERQIHQKSGAVEENAVQKAVQKALEKREREHALEVGDLKILFSSARKTFLRVQREAESFLSLFPSQEKNPPLKISSEPRHIQSIPKPIQTYEKPRQTENGKLRAGAERMLAALVQWDPSGMSEGQMRSHAGLRKSGTFSTYMSDLRTRGYIEARDGLLHATESGLNYFGEKYSPGSLNHRGSPKRMGAKVAGGGAENSSGSRGKAGPARFHGRPHASFRADQIGTFSTYLSDLRTARLILTGGGMARANRETLFL